MTLRVEKLTKSFGENRLFEALSFETEGPAVLWAPSGWGKTTLLRILMGLEKPDAGRVAGVGRVGAVFQEDRLCPQLTAVENVLLVLPDGRARRRQVEAGFSRRGLEGGALARPAARRAGPAPPPPGRGGKSPPRPACAAPGRPAGRAARFRPP